MKIGVPKEIMAGEHRVALVPESGARLVAAGHHVLVETGAGTDAYIDDLAYAGAQVVPDPEPSEVLDSLRMGVNVEVALAAQQLEVKHSSESYLATGEFKMRDWIDQLRTLSADSVERQGFPRMRAVGEMSWALRSFPGSEDLFAYESEVNRFVDSYQVLYFCLYDVDHISGSMVMDAIKTHPQILIGGCLFENPYYMEPEHFLVTRTPALAGGSGQSAGHRPPAGRHWDADCGRDGRGAGAS